MTAPALPKQETRCPYCRKPVPSLLSGCDEDDCRRRELDDDRAFEEASDR